MKTNFIYLLLTVLVFTVSGCMPGVGNNSIENQAGFFMGIWHGWIAPISLLMGFFNHRIAIYEIYNVGWWYDLGFYIAIISGFGGISLFRKSSKDE
jgi:hypothetical protein